MTLEEYIDHLIAGDEEACLAVARDLAGDVSGLHRLYVEMIQPSQYRVGEMWESGKISVATEHIATAINGYVATDCYSLLAQGESGGPKAMVASIPEEMHELGPRLFSDLLECDGWDVDLYGASMSLHDLIEAVREHRPRFLGLSVALVMHLGSVKRTITSIREALGSEAPPIVVGGNAFRGGDDLWKKVGADLYAADASEAVAMLRYLRD